MQSNIRDPKSYWKSAHGIVYDPPVECSCYCFILENQAFHIAKNMALLGLMQVTRRLIKAALQDPLNQRFILLSESCVPLYSPLVVYQQLMHELRSRISACAIPGIDLSSERCLIIINGSMLIYFFPHRRELCWALCACLQM